MNEAFIAIGSNLGDRLKNCETAIQELLTFDSTQLLKKSSFYETEPLTRNGKETSWYLNGVIHIRTDLTRDELFKGLQEIEATMGRKHRRKWEDRIIDLDLLFFNNVVFASGRLRLPHPALHERRFVLEPLSEIAPSLVHPLLKKNVRELLAELDSDLTVKRIQSP